MTKAGHPNTKLQPPAGRSGRLNTAALDRLIEQATVDAYDVEEQRTGFYTMIEEEVAFPFTATVLGVEVTVKGVDFNSADEIVAVCVRGKDRQAIPILDLPLPDPPPKGAEWIAAYRRWARGWSGGDDE
jgi:hypothetical protein